MSKDPKNKTTGACRNIHNCQIEHSNKFRILDQQIPIRERKQMLHLMNMNIRSTLTV